MSGRNLHRIIMWFRRDLRVHDNPALTQACVEADEVIPLFIVDDAILSREDTGPARVEFLCDALVVLDRNLAKLGGRLICRQGKVIETLVRCAREFEAEAVFFHYEYEPYGIGRDRGAAEELQSAGVEVRQFPGLCVSSPGDIVSQNDTPYTVFTPYKKRWLDEPRRTLCRPPKTIRVPDAVRGESLPSAEGLRVASGQKFDCGGEDSALNLLERFTKDCLTDYGVRRDLLGVDGTSKLSRHLHFGTISPLTILSRVSGRPGAGPFLSEIAWRDFYFQILRHFPHVEKGSFRAHLGEIDWPDDEALFEAWRVGKTGYPIVDAAMRQLNQEAWMHNRARMIVASFLTKDLLINWQRGEQYFMQKLVDGDLAANNGGWQWAAGTGTDAQPFFRIFNPVVQAEKFDPDGSYVRRYLPELSRIPDKVIHSPWKLSALEQEYCGCVIGRDYPAPVVDHRIQRSKALQLYRAAGVND